MALPFLDKFRKEVSKLGTVNVGVMKSETWLSTGNYALNYALSGDFQKGVPQGRITLWAGPSGSGKSFISSNIMVQAQAEGYHVLALDSENALDVDYLQKIGVDTSPDAFTYVRVAMIEDVNRVLSEFFQNYITTYGKDNETAPKTLIVLDSLAMLSSATELENYEKDGTIKSDQGILAKRRKAMLRLATAHLAALPIAMVITDHVYPQDIMMGDGAWAITNSTKFSSSIIGIITKLKLKEEGEVTGVRMRFETYKSRFAKLGTKVELAIPYNKGMSPFSGLVDLLEELKVVEDSNVAGKKQGWKMSNINGEKFLFRPDEMTHEDAKKLFTHPNAAPVREQNDVFEVESEESDDKE